MAAAIKGSFQPDLHQNLRQLDIHESSRQAKNIRIIMLPAETSHFGIADHRGSNTLDLVSRHTDSNSGAAHENAAPCFSIPYLNADLFGKIGIVHAIRRIGTNVVEIQTQFFDVA